MSTAQAKFFTEPRVRLWTSEEYYKLAEVGLFEGKRVELIGGKVIERRAQSRPYVRAVKCATRALERAFGEVWFVQSQAPLDLDDLDGDSQPEPDVAATKTIMSTSIQPLPRWFWRFLSLRSNMIAAPRRVFMPSQGYLITGF